MREVGVRLIVTDTTLPKPPAIAVYAPSSFNSDVSNCPSLILCANSMPLIVTAAFPNRLDPDERYTNCFTRR
jgi:hypothetical protein